MVMTGGWFMTLFYPHYTPNGQVSDGENEDQRDFGIPIFTQNCMDWLIQQMTIH